MLTAEDLLELSYEKYEALCKSRNVTSYKVAKATGIRQTTLSEWKHKVSMPKLYTFYKLAQYFNVTVDYFCRKG